MPRKLQELVSFLFLSSFQPMMAATEQSSRLLPIFCCPPRSVMCLPHPRNQFVRNLPGLRLPVLPTFPLRRPSVLLAKCHLSHVILWAMSVTYLWSQISFCLQQYLDADKGSKSLKYFFLLLLNDRTFCEVKSVGNIFSFTVLFILKKSYIP